MIKRTHDGLVYFQFHTLAGQPGLVHAISSRHGGVSEAPYDTLNLSLTVGDDPERVRTNRRHFARALGVPMEHVAAAQQVHGADVWAVDFGVPPPKADILVTAKAGQFLSQRFADCVPLLLWDPLRGAIASAHAGWRGTALGVAGRAVEALSERCGSSPSDLLVGIGPSIGPCCFEVGPEVVGRFAEHADCARPIEDSKAMLDLWELNRRTLVEAGVPETHIEVARMCTRCHSATFFSHRAAGGPAGRFGSLIGLVA